MAFAIDISGGHGLSNEAHHVTVDKEQIFAMQKPFIQLYITNKMEYFSFKMLQSIKDRLAYKVTVRILA